jgi:hypothetical protein
VDLGLGKRFALFTKQGPFKLQIRGEAFNVSNTEFGDYTSVLGSPR